MRLSLCLAIYVSAASAAGPCDILAAANNPCVAAHSTVRSLYAAYSVSKAHNVRTACALYRAHKYAHTHPNSQPLTARNP